LPVYRVTAHTFMKTFMSILEKTHHISRKPASGIEIRMDEFRTELRMTLKIFYFK